MELSLSLSLSDWRWKIFSFAFIAFLKQVTKGHDVLISIFIDSEESNTSVNRKPL